MKTPSTLIIMDGFGTGPSPPATPQPMPLPLIWTVFLPSAPAAVCLPPGWMGSA